MTIQVKREMVGAVTNVTDREVTVSTPDVAPHLRTLYLPRRGKSFDVGDRVRLGYVTTPTSGLWELMGKVTS